MNRWVVKGPRARGSADVFHITPFNVQLVGHDPVFPAGTCHDDMSNITRV